ncbi:Glycerophosphocholine phosphodiesterase [Lecanicillium sp. MT-2017a]|nr:Glycerophosphocholine phosphodiesterase [Lecanicillium sp. MT-2017a]
MSPHNAADEEVHAASRCTRTASTESDRTTAISWEERLHQAIKRGWMLVVADLLSEKGPPHYGEFDVLKALKSAVTFNQVAIFRLLLGRESKAGGAEDAADADEDKRIRDRGHCLLFAAEKGSAAIIKELLKEGVDPNFADFYGETALTRAAERGYLDIIRVLIDDERLNVQMGKRFGDTPFILALKSKQPDAAKMLLPSTCDSSKTTMRGLELAIRYEMKGIVLGLLEREDWESFISQSIFTQAAECGDTCVIGMLQKASATPALLRAALCRSSLPGRVEAMKTLLLRAGSTWEDGFGPSPLYYAALGGHIECVKLLLNAKFRFVSRTYCPKAAARSMGHTGIVSLLENDSDPKRQNIGNKKRKWSLVAAQGPRRNSHRAAAVRSGFVR